MNYTDKQILDAARTIANGERGQTVAEAREAIEALVADNYYPSFDAAMADAVTR